MEIVNPRNPVRRPINITSGVVIIKASDINKPLTGLFAKITFKLN